MSGERGTHDGTAGLEEGAGKTGRSLAEERVGFVEALEVEVSVEVARIALSAGELSALDAGDILRLDRALVAPLDLWVGKRRIGRAELVDVDGEAGLRVIEIYD